MILCAGTAHDARLYEDGLRDPWLPSECRLSLLPLAFKNTLYLASGSNQSPVRPDSREICASELTAALTSKLHWCTF